uniref:Uncharacterized protein n=1 Tax=Meloidogyne enterolobii TaxID=390850 RepID=A0A6V7X9V8_MELEN|nr:unnamed protein product [Meloidogyne enterolobii]
MAPKKKKYFPIFYNKINISPNGPIVETPKRVFRRGKKISFGNLLKKDE